MKNGSDDPIQDHYKFGPLADDGAMDTDEALRWSSHSSTVTSQGSKVVVSSLYHFNKRSSTRYTLQIT